jgi:hypothetical protein
MSEFAASVLAKALVLLVEALAIRLVRALLDYAFRPATASSPPTAFSPATASAAA